MKSKNRGKEMPDPTEQKEESESDEELGDFIPSISSATITSTGSSALSAAAPSQIAGAMEESDSEGEQGGVGGLLSPPPAIQSRTPSRDDNLLNSDDEGNGKSTFYNLF